MIGMGIVAGFPPLVASQVIGHLTDTELIGTNSSKTITGKIIIMLSHRSK